MEPTPQEKAEPAAPADAEKEQKAPAKTKKGKGKGKKKRHRRQQRSSDEEPSPSPSPREAQQQATTPPPTTTTQTPAVAAQQTPPPLPPSLPLAAAAASSHGTGSAPASPRSSRRKPTPRETQPQQPPVAKAQSAAVLRYAPAAVVESQQGSPTKAAAAVSPRLQPAAAASATVGSVRSLAAAFSSGSAGNLRAQQHQPQSLAESAPPSSSAAPAAAPLGGGAPRWEVPQSVKQLFELWRSREASSASLASAVAVPRPRFTGFVDDSDSDDDDDAEDDGGTGVVSQRRLTPRQSLGGFPTAAKSAAVARPRQSLAPSMLHGPRRTAAAAATTTATEPQRIAVSKSAVIDRKPASSGSLLLTASQPTMSSPPTEVAAAVVAAAEVAKVEQQKAPEPEPELAKPQPEKPEEPTLASVVADAVVASADVSAQSPKLEPTAATPQKSPEEPACGATTTAEKPSEESSKQAEAISPEKPSKEPSPAQAEPSPISVVEVVPEPEHNTAPSPPILTLTEPKPAEKPKEVSETPAEPSKSEPPATPAAEPPKSEPQAIPAEPSKGEKTPEPTTLPEAPKEPEKKHTSQEPPPQEPTKRPTVPKIRRKAHKRSGSVSLLPTAASDTELSFEITEVMPLSAREGATEPAVVVTASPRPPQPEALQPPPSSASIAPSPRKSPRLTAMGFLRKISLRRFSKPETPAESVVAAAQAVTAPPVSKPAPAASAPPAVITPASTTTPAAAPQGTPAHVTVSATATATPPAAQTPSKPSATDAAEAAMKAGTSTGVLNEDWKSRRAWASITPGGPPPGDFAPRSVSEMPREHVLELRKKYEDELVFSEEYYVEKLRVIVEMFLYPLNALKNDPNPQHMLLTAQEIAAIFSNIEIILRYNEVLLTQMKKWKTEGNGQIGAIFLRITDFLKIYIAYINNFPAATKVASDLLAKHKRFSEFINTATSHPRCEKLNFLALLIMPVQRIPRYVLLLRELIKYTLPDDPDLPNLNKALNKMQNVAEDINAKKKDAENLAKIQEIQSQLVLGKFPSLFSVPSRRFVKEGQLYEFTERGVEVGYYYLFSDCICRSTMTSHNKRKLRQLLPLTECAITQFNLGDGRHTVATSRRKKLSLIGRGPGAADFEMDTFAFAIEHAGQAHALAGLTEDETRSWLAAIAHCLEEVEQRQKTFQRDTQ